MKKRSIFADVEKLGKHISTLLQDNDCVVLPGFGGFIARAASAHYAAGEHLYLPPTRTIAFNSRLTDNDGLLVRRYMSDMHTSYAQASRLVEQDIDALADMLATEGTATLPGVGVLTQDIHSTFHFSADRHGIDSPALCGLDAIAVSPLRTLQAGSDTGTAQPVITTTAKTIDIHIGRRFVRAASAAAATVLFALLLALPFSDGRQPNVAGLPLAPFAAVSSSAGTESSAVTPATATATTPATATAEPAASRSSYPFRTVVTAHASGTATETATATPAADTEAPAQQTPQAGSPAKPYHIIIASLPSERNADRLVEKYTARGFADTRILKVDNYVRISLASFADKDEAIRRLREIRADETYKHAWVFTEKRP